MFDIISIIDNYSVEYEAEAEAVDELSDAGVKINNEIEWNACAGVIVSITPNEIKLDEAGFFTIQDKKLFSLYKHKPKSKIKYKDKIYVVYSYEDISDFVNKEYTHIGDGEEGVYIYILKNEGRPLDDY